MPAATEAVAADSTGMVAEEPLWAGWDYVVAYCLRSAAVDHSTLVVASTYSDFAGLVKDSLCLVELSYPMSVIAVSAVGPDLVLSAERSLAAAVGVLREWDCLKRL